jgi:hypothetical protein
VTVERRFLRVLFVSLAVPALAAGFFYGGIELYAYRSDVVTRNAEKARAHLDEVTVGMSKDEVRGHLGSPSRRSDHCWVYGKGRIVSVSHRVVVCFAKDTVRSARVESDYAD